MVEGRDRRGEGGLCERERKSKRERVRAREREKEMDYIIMSVIEGKG